MTTPSSRPSSGSHKTSRSEANFKTEAIIRCHAKPGATPKDSAGGGGRAFAGVDEGFVGPFEGVAGADGGEPGGNAGDIFR